MVKQASSRVLYRVMTRVLLHSMACRRLHHRHLSRSKSLSQPLAGRCLSVQALHLPDRQAHREQASPDMIAIRTKAAALAAHASMAGVLVGLPVCSSADAVLKLRVMTQ